MYRYERDCRRYCYYLDFLDVVMPDSRYLVHQTHPFDSICSQCIFYAPRNKETQDTWYMDRNLSISMVQRFLIAPNTVADSNKKIGRLTIQDITPRTCRRFGPYNEFTCAYYKRIDCVVHDFILLLTHKRFKSEERCGRCSSFLLRAPNLFHMFASTNARTQQVVATLVDG
jgi:hypothetical protein